MIEVRGLFKTYGDNSVLKGVDFDVPQGGVAAIIGPSGGGKSTFLRCLNGLETIDNGEVRIGNLAINAQTHPRRHSKLLEELRRRAGFVFQQFNLFPHLTVLQNLIEAPIQVLGLPRDDAIARARALLVRVDLAEKIDAWPKSLSGGQQQRVAIARTLMMQPEVILFDEPTSALDPVMAGEVLSLMADLAKGGQTMIVVTHSMRFAREAATTVHVFSGGHDVEYGSPRAVFENPRHPITQSFLKDVL